MIPSELELSIQKSITKGQHPLMIVATAGTTTRGSIDPIEALVSIAKKYSLWLHVDATWGGSLLFSSTYRLRLKGIEQADSLAWDAHKTFGIPLSCAVFICKQKGLLKKISAVGKSDYLFQESEDKDANLGELSLQCGRRIDALKLWLIWKSLGTIGLESWMDNAVHLAQQAQAFIQADSRFELLSEAHSFAVCFRPTHQLNHAENHVDTLQKTLRASGTVLINRVTVNNQRAFRLITTHYQLTFEDIKTLLHHIDVTSHSLGD
jgi:glutamate/tyrosine decarboxylase-like PLP-dependent enzyme